MKNKNSKNSYNPKNRGNNRGKYYGKKEQDNKDCSEDRGKGFNDVSWYAKNERMLRDAASFSYNNPVGTQISMYDLVYPTAASGNAKISSLLAAVPSLMSLRFIPGIGVSTDSSSPANLAAQNIYSFVRYMNSGAKNYDQADLMLYLLAMDSIYAMWNWLKRMYGYAKTYSQVNRTMPNVYALADGINFDDLIANLADYRYQINQLAAQISSFCVPAVMPIFIRHSWMVSNIYKDSANDKSQQYMFVPTLFYKYDETGSKNGGQLQTVYITTTENRPMSAAIAQLKSMIDAIAYSEDIGVMSGDILKAYGQEQLFKISPLEADYQVVPVYNEEVLNQIHNANTVNVKNPANNQTLWITQDPDSGYLLYNPEIELADIVGPQAAMINMPWNEVTPANTMVGTRLTAILAPTKTSPQTFASLGSEFINERIIFTKQASSWMRMSLGYAIQIDGDSTSITVTPFEIIAELSNFDWHQLTPIVYKKTVGEVVTLYLSTFVGDIDNYTIIQPYALNQMHTAALMSEFNVPQIGSF